MMYVFTVGYFNYRYFVNFLVYVMLGMMYGAWVCWEPFQWLQSDEYVAFVRKERMLHASLERPYPMMPHRSEKLEISLSFMLCLAVGGALVLLGGFHVFLVLTGQTTIEFHGNWTQWRRAKKQGTTYKNPYDQGWRLNWQQVYGKRCWFYSMLPSRREPEFLPFPIPGKNTRRRIDRKGHEEDATSKTSRSSEMGGVSIV
jgi:palmitoyltransferase